MITTKKLMREMILLMPQIDQGFLRPFFSYAKEDVSSLQLRILLLLHRDSCTYMSVLADKLFISKQQLTCNVDKLVQMDYLKRSVDEKDRRKFSVCITSSGKEFLATLLNQLQEQHEKQLEKLSEDEKQQLYVAIHELSLLLGKVQL